MLGIPTVTIATAFNDGADDDVTLTVDTSMLSFTAKHLIVRASVQHDSKDSGMYLRLNGDTGNNYNNIRVRGDGTTKDSNVSDADAAAWLMEIDDATSEFGAGEWLIADAFNTTTYKSIMGLGGWDHDYGVWGVMTRWDDTAAITSVTFRNGEGGTNGFGDNSSFELCVIDESYAFGSQLVKSADDTGGFSVGSITQANGHLVCIGNLRTDRDDDADTLKMHYTGSGSSDTTAGNYERQRLYGTSTTLGATNDNDDIFGITSANTASQDSANSFGSFIHYIPNYSDGGNARPSLTLSGEYSDSSKRDIFFDSRNWRDTDSITAFSLIPGVGSNFITNSTLSTYLVPNDSNLIERIELASDTGTIRFDGIPDTYDHLEITAYLRLARASTSHGNELYVNDDTNDANHGAQYINGRGTAVSANNYTSWPGNVQTIANSTAANTFSANVITAYNYKATDRHKLIIIYGGYNDEDSSDDSIDLLAKRWKSTSAITILSIDPGNASLKFLAGSTAELRGISSTIPVGGPADIKKINGIAAANIKKVNTIAKASLGKVNSIT